MVTKKEPSKLKDTGEMALPTTFWGKYAMLFDRVTAEDFAADMVIGSGARATSYANTQQYKVKFSRLCRECGLVFTASYSNERTDNALLPTRDGDRTTFLSQVDATFHLVDPTTDDMASWTSTGTAKNEAADHASLGAKTYAFRGWFSNNFLLSNAHDEKYERNSFAEIGAPETPAPTTARKIKKAEPKTTVAEEFANDKMVKDIGKKLAKLRTTDGKAGDKFLAKYGEVAEDGTFTLDNDKIPYAKAVSVLQSIVEKLEEGEK